MTHRKGCRMVTVLMPCSFRGEGYAHVKPFLGPVFEGFIAAEIVKHQINTGHSKALYYFRDRQGLEVDFLLDLGDKRLALIEAKATRTPVPRHAEPLLRLNKAIWDYDVRRFVVHRASRNQRDLSTMSPGVKAVSPDRLTDLWRTPIH